MNYSEQGKIISWHTGKESHVIPFLKNSLTWLGFKIITGFGTTNTTQHNFPIIRIHKTQETNHEPINNATLPCDNEISLQLLRNLKLSLA